MQAARFEDGVDAVAEAAREPPAALQRPPRQEALSGLAVRIVEIHRAVIGAEPVKLAHRGAELQPHIKQVLPAIGVLLGLQHLDRVTRRDFLGQVHIVGKHRHDALGDLVVDVVLACRLPDRPVDRRQVRDVHLLGILLGERNLGGGQSQHIRSTVSQCDSGSVLIGIGSIVVHIDRQPVGDQHVGRTRCTKQDTQASTGGQGGRGIDVGQRRADRLDHLLGEAVLEQQVLDLVRFLDRDDALGTPQTCCSRRRALGQHGDILGDAGCGAAFDHAQILHAVWLGRIGQGRIRSGASAAAFAKEILERLAHIGFCHLVGNHARRNEGGGQRDRLDRHLAFDLGTVNRGVRVIGRDDGLGRIDHRLRIVGGDVLGQRRGGGREGRTDAHERLLLDQVAAINRLTDRRLDDLELGFGHRHRADAVGLGDEVARRFGPRRHNPERLIGGREGVLALEAHIKRRAHEHDRGQTGHHGAGEPRKAQLAALRDFAVGRGDRQRRSIFETGPNQCERAITLRRIHPRPCPCLLLLSARRPPVGRGRLMRVQPSPVKPKRRVPCSDANAALFRLGGPGGRVRTARGGAAKWTPAPACSFRPSILSERHRRRRLKTPRRRGFSEVQIGIWFFVGFVIFGC